MRNQFFREPAAWCTPSADSMCRKGSSPLFPLLFGNSEFPETASIGETLAALLAGACAASRTVITPTSAPQITPTGLTERTGTEENSLPPTP